MEQHKISCHGEVRVGRTASRSLLGFTRKSSIDCQVVWDELDCIVVVSFYFDKVLHLAQYVDKLLSTVVGFLVMVFYNRNEIFRLGGQYLIMQ